MASSTAERRGLRPVVRGPGTSRPPLRAVAGAAFGAVALHVAGAAVLLGRAWAAVPRGGPPTPFLAALATAFALAEFGLASRFALRASRPPDLWRPVVFGALVAGGLALGFSAASNRILDAAVAFVLLGLAARCGETLGKHLAPLFAAPGDDPGDDSSAQAPETRRVVLETWVGAAAAAAFSHAGGATAILALAAAGAGGLILTAAAKQSAAERLAAADGFMWTAADRREAWRAALAPLGGALALALLIPGLPRVLSGRFFAAPAALVGWLMGQDAASGRTARVGRFPSPGHLAVGLPVGLPTQATVSGGVAANGALLGYRGVVFILLALGALAILVTAVVTFLRFAFDADAGGIRGALRRLWDAILALFDFLRTMLSGGMWGGALREGGRRPRAGDGVPAGVAARDRGGRGPRWAVRLAYGHYLARARAAGLPREAGETPARFERRIRPEVPPAAASPLGSLTRAYEEARWSEHPVGVDLARGVQAAARMLVGLLRRR